MSSQCRDARGMDSFPGWGRSRKPCGMACIYIYIYKHTHIYISSLSLVKKFILGLKLKALHNLALVYWSAVFFSAMTPCSHSHITHTHTHRLSLLSNCIYPLNLCPLGAFFSRHSFFPCDPTTCRRPSHPTWGPGWRHNWKSRVPSTWFRQVT